jgi:spore coat protein CotF
MHNSSGGDKMNQSQLTQKEKLLLQDLKSQEELCIKKYSKYMNEAGDEVLKQLFRQLGMNEEQHLNTINQILSGQTPVMQSGGQAQGQQQSGQSTQFTPTSDLKSPNASQKDFDLVQDLLSTEKYVSATYNTAIFEFNNSQIRKTLNHIQKEEQEHGELLYNYLKQNNAYPLQA